MLSRLRSANMPILSFSSWKCRKIARNTQRPFGMPPVVILSDSTICWNSRPKRPLRQTLISFAAISRSRRGKQRSEARALSSSFMQMPTPLEPILFPNASDTSLKAWVSSPKLRKLRVPACAGTSKFGGLSGPEGGWDTSSVAASQELFCRRKPKAPQYELQVHLKLCAQPFGALLGVVGLCFPVQ